MPVINQTILICMRVMVLCVLVTTLVVKFSEGKFRICPSEEWNYK